MKRPALLLLAAILPICAASLGEESYYRITKTPLEDYQGRLAPGSPTPVTNELTIIDCQGTRRGPFTKEKGYDWNAVSDPCTGKPIRFSVPEFVILTNNLSLGTNYVAFIEAGKGSVIISTDLAGNAPDATENLRKLFDLNSLQALGSKSRFNLTYRIEKAKVSAVLAGWDAEGNTKELISEDVQLDPKAMHAILKKE